jgi:hypothetical protein
VLDDHDTYLPEVLRERVMSTYVLSERVAVRAAAGSPSLSAATPSDGSLFSQAFRTPASTSTARRLPTRSPPSPVTCPPR